MLFLQLFSVLTTLTSTIYAMSGNGKNGKFHMGQSLNATSWFFFFFPQCFTMNNFKHYPYAYYLSSTINILPCLLYLYNFYLFIYNLFLNHAKLPTTLNFTTKYISVHLLKIVFSYKTSILLSNIILTSCPFSNLSNYFVFNFKE